LSPKYEIVSPVRHCPVVICGAERQLRLISEISENNGKMICSELDSNWACNNTFSIFQNTVINVSLWNAPLPEIRSPVDASVHQIHPLDRLDMPLDGISPLRFSSAVTYCQILFDEMWYGEILSSNRSTSQDISKSYGEESNGPPDGGEADLKRTMKQMQR
jgi:hypothetical protein